MNTQENKNKDYLLPISIIIAALLISGSWIYTAGLKNTGTGNGPAVTTSGAAATDGINIKPVGADDHILGNPEAPVKIVEFSDLECPFCKSFHPTMKRVLREYGKDGRVAWVYRQYPIESLHPINGRRAAEASECAAEFGGNEKFWAYVDKYFEATPSNDQIEPAEILKIGARIGLNPSLFESCVSSGKYRQRVDDMIADGTKAGLRGTPYSVVITKDGKKYPINGAQPYEQVKLLIDEALR